MAETRFTPGPWNIAQDIYDGRIGIGSTSGVVVAAPKNTAGVQGIANARLIAAAPELYEALEALAADQPWQNAPHDLLRIARAALARARGEAGAA